MAILGGLSHTYRVQKAKMKFSKKSDWHLWKKAAMEIFLKIVIDLSLIHSVVHQSLIEFYIIDQLELLDNIL